MSLDIKNNRYKIVLKTQNNMKKMVSIKLDDGFEILLKKLSKKNNRSQGQQVQNMIELECKKQNIK